jgi:glycogen(starch) synthase
VSEPTRVLMTTDAVGGVWTYAVDLARDLATAGVATTLAVLGPRPSQAQRRDADAVEGLELVETGLALDWMAAGPAEIEAAASGIRGLARETGADLIHLNSPALAICGVGDAPVLGVCHSCLATWWGAVKQGPMPEDFRWRTDVLRRGMAACDELVAPTAAFADATAAAHKVRRPRVVHNGRTPFTPPITRAREKVIFTSGRLWDEGKNIAVLDAAAGLAGVELRAAGSQQGPTGQNSITLAHAKGLGLRSADEVARELAGSAIYATSALYEPFGLGVLEAAEAGCALVLSDIPTFRELWDGAAIFVQPNDPEAFARVFLRLTADPAILDDLARAARARAAAYSVSAMTRGVLQVYRDLGAQRASRRGRAA